MPVTVGRHPVAVPVPRPGLPQEGQHLGGPGALSATVPRSWLLNFLLC